MKLSDIKLDNVSCIEITVDGGYVDQYHSFYIFPNPNDQTEVSNENPTLNFVQDVDIDFVFNLDTECNVEDNLIIFTDEGKQYELTCYKYVPAELV